MNQTQEDAKKNVKRLTLKVNELIEKTKRIILATVNAEGVLTSSYVPFTKVENTFYIVVSFMAKHTKNLIEGKAASIMFIEDEFATKEIYARERLLVEVSASEVERGSEKWEIIVSDLKDIHWGVVHRITDIKDFILIGLHPVKGSYADGIGSVYFVGDKLEVMKHRK